MRRDFSRTVALFGLLLFSLPASSDAGQKSGRITGMIKSVSGSPLHDAVVRIFRQVREGEALTVAKTNNQGFFKSASLTPGTYYLQISRQGYEPVTTTKFIIDPGRTASLDIVLQEFVGFITNNEDPRNWDLKTVMRSTSDRRMIFRGLPGSIPADPADSTFYRTAAMSIASSSTPSGHNYLAFSQASQNGVSSNFAFAEPVSQHSRMILSGQLDFGNGAFWRLRNTYNYRPSNDSDYRLSVGYGQMNVNYPGFNSVSPQMLSPATSPGTAFRESGVKTLAFGVEGNTNFMDLMAIRYGFDFSRLSHGDSKSFFNPSLQILVRPAEGWNIQTSFTSRRLSDTNSVTLPDGEILNLSEPTLITMVGNRVSMSQVRHSEISAEREIGKHSALEFAVYQDRTKGPGLPVMVTTITPVERNSQVIEMNEDQYSQRGVRVTLRRQLTENLGASVAYVYGDSMNITGVDGIVLSEGLNALADYMQQRNQHSITGRLDATIPLTRTNILATVRWYSGSPINPVDWFSDRMDIGTKSTNFEIRQIIPVPEFIGSTSRWEILMDLRNVLNQGKEVLPTSDGEIVLNRNPRSMRFGLSVSFR